MKQPQLDLQAVLGWTIRVRGTVQGVGFRPTVYKLAIDCGITGSVLNDGEGVLIEAWGSDYQLADFIQVIKDSAPPLARIEKIEHWLIEQSESGAVDFQAVPHTFVIDTSAGGLRQTNISADAATCNACLQDLFNPLNRRFRYPFTNCTHCGPRLSIIKSIPYDRESTSMAIFPMCADCKKEYEDPADRRFHAQPNACHACGPRAWLERSDGRTFCPEIAQIDQVDSAANLIQRGEIVAVKGIGGFHLACDATNEEAVARLRMGKKRYHKPFALMARDTTVIRKYCRLSEQEANIIASAAAPVVVLEANEYLASGADTADFSPVAASVAPGQKTLGFMLPYTPLHHLLLQRLNKPIVLTSANLSEEPQSIDNDDARARLADIADYLLLHDRAIINRLDDSVVRVSCGAPAYLRRARGAAPAPLLLPSGFEHAPDLIAMGSELKNTFCLIKGGKAIVSQHIGDLEEAKTFADYKRNLIFYKNCYQHQALRIAVDLHPEYLSRKVGLTIAAGENLPVDEIQHHHAHIASCLADNGHGLNAGPVLGIALDGLGYGCDNTFWGGEFLLADYCSFERLGTFKPVALLGGAQAMREPWRNTYAHLMAAMGWPKYKADFAELELTEFFLSKQLASFDSMLKSGVGAPLASSCGRLFDAVAAAVGICRQQASYEGQAAIELEAMVDRLVLEKESEDLAYQFSISNLPYNGIPYIEPLAVWQAIFADLVSATAPGTIAARFHKGLARAIVQMVQKLCIRENKKWLETVALSGGVFQNKILEELVYRRLTAEGFKVLVHGQVPANDGGLSLGQAVISAACQLQKK